MALIHWLQRVAGVVPPVDAALAVLALGAAVATVTAWRRSPKVPAADRAGLGYLVLAPASLLALRAGAGWLFVPLLVVALAVLFRAVLSDATPASEPPGSPSHLPAGPGYLAAAVVAAIVLLFADLGGYAGRVMIWEYDTSWNLAHTVRAGQSTASFLAHRLGWSSGLVSTGDDALLFGGGVHLAWKVLPISPATLRLPAAMLALGCLPAVWWAVRRCVGPTAATASVVALSVAPPLAYYGRYGTSLSGSLLSLLLAIGACCAASCGHRTRWWHGLRAGAALFLATLGYAPFRLAVVGLFVGVVLNAVLRVRRDHALVAPTLVLVLVAGAVWLGQARAGRANLFVDVRGEQILRMLSESGWLEGYLGIRRPPEELRWRDRLEVAGRLLDATAPQLGRTLATGLATDEHPEEVLHTDPPRLPLGFPVALVFALWGFATSCRRPTSAPHLLLLSAFAISVVPVLFTTRVDAHRMLTLVAPLAIWTGMGAAAAIRAVKPLDPPRAVLHGAAVALLFLGVVEASRLLYYPAPPDYPIARRVLDGAALAPGPVLLVTELDFQDLGVVVLESAERHRRHPGRAPRVVHRDRAYALSDRVGPTEEDLPLLVSAVRRGGAAMLVPVRTFTRLAELAETHGLAVERRETEGLAYWWITAPR